MTPDPGRRIQESIIASMGLEARVAVRERLNRMARLLAWQRSDAAGPMSELARAEFGLRRLYPDLPDAALRQVLEQLAAAEAAGEWQDFRRPGPMPS